MNPVERERTLYQSFNARNLPPEEVARTFVVNDQFRDLVRANHTVLMGPRGSGKTTLLKMLTPMALHEWQGPEAEELKRQISFAAIYVPSDVHWHHQLLYSADQLDKHPKFCRVLSGVAVTTNVLWAACDAMAGRARCEFEGEYAPEKECEVCTNLIRAWNLPPSLPSFSALRRGLEERMNAVGVKAERVMMLSDPDDAVIRELDDYYFFKYLDAVRLGCSAFDEVFGQGRTRPWALCFDELEMAPDWLQDLLMSELKSTDQRFIFKLSASPIPRFWGKTEARPGHDFQPVRLWPQDPDYHHRFCRDLASSALKRRFRRKMEPEQLLGLSPFAGKPGHRKEYAPGSPVYETLRNVARQDPGLRELLERHSISPENPTTSDIAKRDEVLRKAKPIALMREASQKEDESSGRMVERSRKLAEDIYYGADMVYDISDGNPRCLIGILNDLCDRADTSGPFPRVPRNVQARVLTEASREYSALIGLLPNATAHLPSADVDLFALLRAVGKCFHRWLIVEKFSIDPVGSFIVDSRMPDEVLRILQVAANYGAIVHVDPLANALEAGLRGKRFRLSYTLAPTWRLAPRLYRSAPLSSCLETLRPFSGRRRGLAGQGERDPALPLEDEQ